MMATERGAFRYFLAAARRPPSGAALFSLTSIPGRKIASACRLRPFYCSQRRGESSGRRDNCLILVIRDERFIHPAGEPRPCDVLLQRHAAIIDVMARRRRGWSSPGAPPRHYGHPWHGHHAPPMAYTAKEPADACNLDDQEIGVACRGAPSRK